MNCHHQKYLSSSVLALTAFGALLLCAPSPGLAMPILSETLADYAVLAGSTVTNTGSSTIFGNVGVSPGLAITGFPPGSVAGGTIQPGTEPLAQSDLVTAYTDLAGRSPIGDLTGKDLGTLDPSGLAPGVYSFESSAQLTGDLILNGAGASNAVWIFQIGSTLTTASGSSVEVTNVGPGAGVYWQVGSSATLGTTTAFEGNILALTSITLNTGATIDCGRALAQNGAVTLDTNTISIGCAHTPSGAGTGGFDQGNPGSGGTGGGGTGGNGNVPEPATLLLLGSGLVGLAVWRGKQAA